MKALKRLKISLSSDSVTLTDKLLTRIAYDFEHEVVMLEAKDNNYFDICNC